MFQPEINKFLATGEKMDVDQVFGSLLTLSVLFDTVSVSFVTVITNTDSNRTKNSWPWEKQ